MICKPWSFFQNENVTLPNAQVKKPSKPLNAENFNYC